MYRMFFVFIFIVVAVLSFSYSNPMHAKIKEDIYLSHLNARISREPYGKGITNGLMCMSSEGELYFLWSDGDWKCTPVKMEKNGDMTPLDIPSDQINKEIGLDFPDKTITIKQLKKLCNVKDVTVLH